MKPTKPCCSACRQPLPQPRTERLTPTLAAALEEIAQQTDNGKVFAPIPAYRYRAQHAKLALWGLLEELLFEKKSGSGQTRSGQWRPTSKGMQWLSGMTHVPSEVYVLQGRVVGLGTTPVSFQAVKDTVGMSTKERAAMAADAEGYRAWAREQAQLDREYLDEIE